MVFFFHSRIGLNHFRRGNRLFHLQDAETRLQDSIDQLGKSPMVFPYIFYKPFHRTLAAAGIMIQPVVKRRTSLRVKGIVRTCLRGRDQRVLLGIKENPLRRQAEKHSPGYSGSPAS